MAILRCKQGSGQRRGGDDDDDEYQPVLLAMAHGQNGGRRGRSTFGGEVEPKVSLVGDARKHARRLVACFLVDCLAGSSSFFFFSSSFRLGSCCCVSKLGPCRVFQLVLMPPVLFRSTWGEGDRGSQGKGSLCCFKLLLQTVEPAVWTFGVWAANATQGNTTQLVFFGPKRLSSPIGGMPYDSMPESRDAREEDTKKEEDDKSGTRGVSIKGKNYRGAGTSFWAGDG